MKRHAVVWIDTDGEFHVKGFEHEEEAAELEEALNAGGLPTTYVSRERLVDPLGGIGGDR